MLNPEAWLLPEKSFVFVLTPEKGLTFLRPDAARLRDKALLTNRRVAERLS
jgi:hypothetical protein